MAGRRRILAAGAARRAAAAQAPRRALQALSRGINAGLQRLLLLLLLVIRAAGAAQGQVQALGARRRRRGGGHAAGGGLLLGAAVAPGCFRLLALLLARELDGRLGLGPGGRGLLVRPVAQRAPRRLLLLAHACPARAGPRSAPQGPATGGGSDRQLRLRQRRVWQRTQIPNGLLGRYI